MEHRVTEVATLSFSFSFVIVESLHSEPKQTLPHIYSTSIIGLAVALEMKLYIALFGTELNPHSFDRTRLISYGTSQYSPS